MSEPEASEPNVDLDRYRRFIAQIELRDIWLVSSKLANRHGPVTPEDQVRVVVEDRSSWAELDDGFRAVSRYSVRFKVKNRVVATVDAEFAADFASNEPMTDDLFLIFAPNNLPLNTWPYFREYLSSAVGRMGWLPFILPARKIGASS